MQVKSNQMSLLNESMVIPYQVMNTYDKRFATMNNSNKTWMKSSEIMKQLKGNLRTARDYQEKIKILTDMEY